MQDKILSLIALSFALGQPLIGLAIGGALIWLPTLGVLGLDVGCGVDYERKSVSCGQGLYVWNELGSSPYRSEFVDFSFMSQFIGSSMKKHTSTCLVCTDMFECSAYIDLAAGEVNYQSDNANFEVNTTFANGQVFKAIDRQIISVTTDNEVFYISRIRRMYNGVVGRNSTDKTLYVQTSSTTRQHCDNAIVFGLSLVGFTRRLYSSHTSFKIVDYYKVDSSSCILYGRQ